MATSRSGSSFPDLHHVLAIGLKVCFGYPSDPPRCPSVHQVGSLQHSDAVRMEGERILGLMPQTAFCVSCADVDEELPALSPSRAFIKPPFEVAIFDRYERGSEPQTTGPFTNHDDPPQGLSLSCPFRVIHLALKVFSWLPVSFCSETWILAAADPWPWHSALATARGHPLRGNRARRLRICGSRPLTRPQPNPFRGTLPHGAFTNPAGLQPCLSSLNGLEWKRIETNVHQHFMLAGLVLMCIYDMGPNSWPQGIPRSIGHCYGQSIELRLGLRLTHTDQEATYRELVGRSMLLFQRGLVNLKGSPLFEIPGFDSRAMFVASLYTVACHSCCYANHQGHPFVVAKLVWVNYNISLTWIKAIWGWFPLLTMIPVRSQWGRYNLPRLVTSPLDGAWKLVKPPETRVSQPQFPGSHRGPAGRRGTFGTGRHNFTPRVHGKAGKPLRAAEAGHGDVDLNQKQ